MFILKSLAAALAFGFVRDTIAAAATPACCIDKCGKPVQLAKNGRKDCSAYLVHTVVPTSTVTSFDKTVTLTRTTTMPTTIVKTKYSTPTVAVTKTTDVTVTAIDIETDTAISTSFVTIQLTDTVTDVATAVQTVLSTTTVPYVFSAPPPGKRNVAVPSKPSYASACDNGAYTRACSCLGVQPTTITKPAVVQTVCKTKTVYKTATAYQTAVAYSTIATATATQVSIVTQTATVTATSLTTVVSGFAVSTTDIATLVESATVTQVSVVVVTQTAPPTLPTCVGNGFTFHITGSTSSVNNYGVGLIESIGQGVYFRLFSGGASSFVEASDGNLQSGYGANYQNTYTSDFQYVVQTGSLPSKVLIESAEIGQATYPFPVTPLTCTLGPAPAYGISCSSTTIAYQSTFCQDPVYYDWYLYLYTDVSQLQGLNCVTDGAVTATCST